MSNTFKLYRLQQIDVQLDHKGLRISEIESLLKDKTALNNAIKNELSSRQLREDAYKQLQLAERNLESQRLKIEQTDSKLYSGKISNPKELEDLQNESVALKRFRGVLEDRLLEAMIKEEEARNKLDEAAQLLSDEQGNYDLQQTKLSNEKNSLNNQIQRLQEERKAAISSVSQKDLDLYELLRKQRRGIAVAQVKDNACSACGSILNASLLHSARIPNKITRCETCSRILYSA